MAIAQHQFFLDRNHRKVTKSRNGVVRSLSQIASELCRSVQSLSSASSVSNSSRSNSTSSLPNTVIEGELSEESKAATIEMLSALQSRKDALQETLKRKTEELKTLCLKEGELTGELPPETPIQPGEPQPQIRRRVGTSFTLNKKLICRAKNKDQRESLTNLELDYEIQSKIACAALKLATDISARKSVRKVHKISYQQATDKLKNIEQKLCTLKREKGSKKVAQDSSSEGSGCDKVSNHLRLPASSSENSIADRNGNSLGCGVVLPSTSLPQLSDAAAYASVPSSPAKCRQRHQSLQHVPVITTEVYEDVAFPRNVPTRRSSSTYSAASEYDAMSCGSGSVASLGIPYRNRFEANLNIDGTNLYSVPNRRASQAFNDPEELYLGDAQSQHCENSSKSFANASALSSSFDERMFHQNLEFSVIPESKSAAESLYDKHSIGSNGMCYYDPSYQLPTSCDFPRQDKYIHPHKSDSIRVSRGHMLHHKLDHIHISEPELNFSSSQPDTHSVHNLRVPLGKNLRPTSTIFPAGVSNTSIHKVAEMVQASVLLQDSKRAASSSCLDHSSPKAKTKEWTETSLDSPIIARKQKPKQSDISPPSHHELSEWLDNGLPRSCASDHQHFEYQSSVQYVEDMNSSIHSYSKYRDSPIHYASAACDDYQNVCVQTPDSMLKERIYVNTSEMNSISEVYHHYENAEELSSNHNRYLLKNTLCRDSVCDDYNTSFKVIQPEVKSHQLLPEFEDTPTKPAIAEPQQPSKYQMRRINSEDLFPTDNICASEPDYENIPVDNDYEPIEFNNTSLSYSEECCDVPDSSSFSHGNDSYKQSSRDSQSENWQHSVQAENSTLSPGSQNLNFSPTVEVNIVSVGHFQPYWEETKPYELSDFYKYSTKHRRQQKLSTSSSSDAPMHARKENLDNSTQVFESNLKETVQYQEHPYSNEASHSCNLLPSMNSHPEIVTSRVPVFGSSAHLESPAKYYAENSVSSPASSSDPNKSLSFGEIQINIADNFHDEMVQWYQNQDTVKKATLV